MIAPSSPASHQQLHDLDIEHPPELEANLA
jgi:hypothetical protein